MRKSKARFCIEVIALMLALTALWACSDSGQSGTVDGDQGNDTPMVIAPGLDGNPVLCETDEDCMDLLQMPIAECKPTDDGAMVCWIPEVGTCEETCNKLAGCYCVGDDCICDDEDGDEDYESTSDGPLPSAPGSLDFGAVLINTEKTGEIQVCNDGKGVLELNDAVIIPVEDENGKQSDVDEFGFVGETPSPFNMIPLAASDCTTITLSYKPVNPGIDLGELLIGTNVEIVHIDLITREKGKVALKYECPEEFDLGDGNKCCLFDSVAVNEQGVMQIILKNAPDDEDSNKTLVLEEIELDDPNSVFRIDRNTINYGEEGNVYIAPGHDETFSVLFTPRSQSFYQDTIWVPHNDPLLTEDDGLNPYPIPICGAGVVPELVTQPAHTIEFGVVEVNTCEDIDVILSNRGGTTLNIQGANFQVPEPVPPIMILNLDPDSDGADNVPVLLESYEETQIRVSCCPTAAQAYINTLAIQMEYNVSGSPMLIPISCTGITAEMRVWPSSVDFGSVRIGTCETELVTIENNGQADLRINSISIRQSPTDQSSPLSLNFGIDSIISFPLTIPPNKTAEIEVFYCPLEEKSEQAYMWIIPEAGGGDPRIVNLTGKGVRPELQIDPTTINWADAQVPSEEVAAGDLDNWKDCKEIIVTNSGTERLLMGEIRVPNGVSSEFTLQDNTGAPDMGPGQTFTFRLCYLPEHTGPRSGFIVLCSDAWNATGSDFACNDSTMKAHEIAFTANAINPRLDVYPLGGEINFGQVQVENEVVQETVTLRNIGDGNMYINDVQLLTDMPQLGFEILEINPDPSTWDNGVYTLTDNESMDYMTINIKYDPEIPGFNQNYLIVSHSDKNAAFLGQEPGAQYPDMFIKLFGTSEVNIPPVAIAKSPINDPPGDFGSVSRTINVGQTIYFDGSASYDPDDDPATPAAEDAVSRYLWSSPQEGQFEWLDSTDAMQPRARFDYPGTYEIKLSAWDTHDEPSRDTQISKIMIQVRKAPTAVNVQCNTGETWVDIEVGDEVCFDGSGSFDDSGTLTAYTWYVQENWPTGNVLRYDGEETFNYTFNSPGNHRVYLVVVDDEGVPSAEDPTDGASVAIEAVANEIVRVEMSWLGGGDVNLHWIRPAGQFGNPWDDCSVNSNASPNWHNPWFCGYPQLKQSSTTGINEIEEVDHSLERELCNTDEMGPYKLVAEYVTALQNCWVETEYYLDSCSRCGCSGLGCGWLNCGLPWCDCKSCTSSETVCENIEANVTMKIYVNGSGYPTFVLPGITLYDPGDKYEIPMHRINGMFLPPGAK